MSDSGQTRIELCGHICVELGGRRLEDALPGRQGRLLFAYLLLNRNRPTGRDRLIDLLWPASPPADPNESLSALLSKLRRVVGAETLRGRADLSLVLAPDAWIDLEAARAAAERAEAALTRANPGEAWTEAHAGLEVASRGFFARHDNPWARERSEEVEQLRLRCLESIAAAGVGLGGSESVAAERAAREAIVLAPLREATYRLLMEVLAARGDLAEALQVYEQLRVRLRDELGIVPGRAARALHERLLAGGDQVEKAVTQEPERKVVTVLLADVVPDTDPERTEALLEQLRAVVASEVEACGGALQAATGGGVLVTFGVPAAQEDDARRAIELGHTLAVRLRGIAPVKVAIETGEVLVGRSGPTGLPFQAAARMLQDAEAGAVLIGNRTASAAGSRTRVSQFVGREQEIGALMSVARNVRSPRLVTIVGDAGIGKSRLVRELQARLAAEMPQVRQFLGRCLSYGRGLTYRALGEVLSAVRAQPEAALASRQILDLTLGMDVAGDLHPLAALEQLRLAWVELIEGLASQRPVLLVIEDLHWAQPDLLDVLEQLVSEVVGPLLLVCTARPELPEARPSWGRRREATTLWLEPLEPGDAARLVKDAPAGVRGAVLDRAEGNPFFLEELMACIGKGGDLDAAAISDSIHAVLAARIDQLPRLEKEALQAASVIGRIFWREAVEALLGGVPASFSLLEDRDFVRPRPSSSLEGVRELTFKHALTCEVAYGTLPRARRAQLHGDFARWLEDVGGGPDEHAALLAHHYYEASGTDSGKLRARALHWLWRSGELAIARYEIEEALALLCRALKLDTDDTGRCATEGELAPDYLLVDARTGMTEMSGIATSLLADIVVTLTLTTREHLEGVRSVLRSINKTRAANGDEPVQIEVALSRLTSTNNDDERKSTKSALDFLISQRKIPVRPSTSTRSWSSIPRRRCRSMNIS